MFVCMFVCLYTYVCLTLRRCNITFKFVLATYMYAVLNKSNKLDN